MLIPGKRVNMMSESDNIDEISGGNVEETSGGNIGETSGGNVEETTETATVDVDSQVNGSGKQNQSETKPVEEGDAQPDGEQQEETLQQTQLKNEAENAEVKENAKRGNVQSGVPALTDSLSNTHLSKSVVKLSKEPLELKSIPHGEPGVRTKLRFDVVTARVTETGGKKHVSYSVMMKRINSPENHSAVIERRYNDFCYVYECILRNFHPSILGDFLFPKKVLIGNFKAEVITERTEAFHKFLNLIANCDNLLYSDYFYSFLSSEEHNEAVSHIKLSRYEEAIPLLENIFYVREKLLTISNIHVLQCLCELVATLAAVGRVVMAFSYAKVAQRSFDLVKGHPDAEVMRVSFLKLASQLAGEAGHDRKQYDKQLSELRYQGIKLENAKPLLEMIRDRYIHRASHTAKIA